MDNQDHGPSMKAVQQGLLAGAAPQGSSLSLSLSLSLGLWVSLRPLGTETVEPTSLRGPHRHQARNTRRGRFAEFRWSVPDRWPGSEASIFCAYFTCQTVCTCVDMMRENNFNRGKKSKFCTCLNLCERRSARGHESLFLPFKVFRVCCRIRRCAHLNT